jgi:hypothetical protein
VDNKAFLAKGKLAMPMLALGGEKSFGKTIGEVMRFAATDVQEGVIRDSGPGLWKRTQTLRLRWLEPFSHHRPDGRCASELSGSFVGNFRCARTLGGGTRGHPGLTPSRPSCLTAPSVDQAAPAEKCGVKQTFLEALSLRAASRCQHI